MHLVKDRVGVHTNLSYFRSRTPDVSVLLLCVGSYPPWCGKKWAVLRICKIKVLMGLLKAEGDSEKWNYLQRRETVWGQTLDLL